MNAFTAACYNASSPGAKNHFFRAKLFPVKDMFKVLISVTGSKTALGSTVDSLMQPVAQAVIKKAKHLGYSELKENNMDSFHVF